MEKLNVVLLNLTVDQTVSGVNRYLETLSAALIPFQDIVVHQVTLLQKPGMFFHQITKAGDVVNATIMLPQNMKPIVSGLYWMERYAGVVAKLLLPHFLGMKNLIWHTHCINLSQLAMLLKQEAGGIHLTHLHCIPWKFALENNIPRFKEMYRKYQNRQFESFNDTPVEKLAYQAADRIICVTNSGKNYLTEAMHVSPDKVSVVYNSVGNLPVATAGRKDGKDIHVLYAGRISKEKGVPHLLQALLQVYERGYPVRITLAGSGNATYIKSLASKYARLKPDFRGNVGFDELKTLYENCTMGIIPSLHEQCSYVAMEMGMCGVPLIVSDTDGLGEIFTDGENALKVPVVFDEKDGLRPDGHKLADSIIRLIGDKPLRLALGRQAEELFRRQFNTGRMGEETTLIYRSFFTSPRTCGKPASDRKISQPEITVVLPFRNTGEKIRAAVADLFRHCKPHFRVIAIDDASDDAFNYNRILGNIERVEYIRNNKELGLAGSWDKGVMAAETEFVLLLDEHARIVQDILSPILDYCHKTIRNLVCLQSRMWTPGYGGIYYKLETEPAGKGGAIDFFGIRGPLELCREILTEEEYAKNVLPVPCACGNACCIRKNYYIYLHGLNGLTDGRFRDAFLSTKVWLEGGECTLLRNADVGHVYYPALPTKENEISLAYEKIVYARLLMEKWAEDAEDAVKLHLAGRSGNIINGILGGIQAEIEKEKTYLSGIFTRSFEDIFNLNQMYGNRIYPK